MLTSSILDIYFDSLQKQKSELEKCLMTYCNFQIHILVQNTFEQLSLVKKSHN